MEWFQEAVGWLVVGGLFFWLHAKMHRGHRHGGGGHGQGHGGCCGGGHGHAATEADGRREEKVGHHGGH